MVRMRLWFGIREDIHFTYYWCFYACAKDANHSQTIRIARSLYFLFSTKAHRWWPWPTHIWQCVDFLTSSEVEIGSWFHSTLKDTSRWEITKLRFHDRITVFCMLLVVSQILYYIYLCTLMLYDSVISCKLDARDSQDILGLLQMGKRIGVSILEIPVCYRKDRVGYFMMNCKRHR